MTVAPASRPILPLPAADIGGAREAAEPDRSFADLLGELLAATTGPASSGEQQRRFNLELAIEHGAVRFDARPLVGPANVPGETADPSEPAEPSGGGVRGVPHAGGADVRAALAPWASSGATGAPSSPVASPRAGGGHELVTRAPVSHPPGGFAVELPGGLAAAEREASATQSAAKASPEQQASRRSARPPAATLTVTPSEVLVTVHGVDLSRAEQDALIEQVRDLLATYHPGRRAIRLGHPARKA